MNCSRGDEVYDITGLFKYESGTNKEAALQWVIDHVTMEFITTAYNVKIDGQFMEITGGMDIPHW